jgi:hypothetical protein
MRFFWVWFLVTVATACGGRTRGSSRLDVDGSVDASTSDGGVPTGSDASRGELDAPEGAAEAVGNAEDGSQAEADVGVIPACLLDPSSYDQSCEQDSDCTTQVTFGDICDPQNCVCSNGLVNKSSYAQYDMDLMHALTLRPSNGIICNCNEPPAGCCSIGKCVYCSGPKLGSPVVDAALDAPTE